MRWPVQAYIQRGDGKFFMTAPGKAILFDESAMDSEEVVLYDRVRIDTSSDQVNVRKCIIFECEWRSLYT